MRLTLTFLLLSITLALSGQERFTTWHADLHPRADRSLEVIEELTVVSEGEAVKRGITRSLPVSDAHPVEILGVERDGAESPYHTRQSGGMVTVYAGDKKKTLRPGTYSYRIRYRIDQAVGRADSLDELQFEVVGPDVSLPVEQASATLHLPTGLGVTQYACYTGAEGSAGRNCTQTAPDGGRLTFTGSGRFGLGEQFSVAAGFTSGFFSPLEVQAAVAESPPTWLEREGSIALFILLVFGALYYAYNSWRKYGVDPPAPQVGTVAAPPQGLSPAAVAYLASDFGVYEANGFTASLLALATAGMLRIEGEEESGWLGTQHHYRFAATQPRPEGVQLPPEQQSLYEQLFAGRATLTVKPEYDKSFHDISQSHKSAVESSYDHLLTVESNLKRALPLAGLYAAGVGAGFLAAVYSGEALMWPLVISYIVLGGIGLGVYIWLIRRPSPELVRLRTEIAALREYLGLPESKRKRLLNAPPMTEAHYEELLPYAIALGINTEWTGYFTQAVNPASYRPVWVVGASAFQAGHFEKHFSQTVGASTTQAQSSASSGGGSVGGGVGGGGAGGW